MHETTSEFLADDDHPLFCRRWAPSDENSGHVLIVHGLGEHSGRYQNVAAELVDAGYCVTAFDQRGHGKTKGRRGHVSHYDRLLRDIDCVMARLPEVRSRFLYGQSLGGNIVLNYALRYRPNVDGIVVSSPLLLPTHPPPRWKEIAAKMLSAVCSTFNFNSHLNPEDLSSDADAVRAYKLDPLVHGKVSARLATEMLKAGRFALQHASQLAMPILLLHGEQDQITSSHASRVFADRAGANCDLFISESGFHELHWESDRMDYLARIVDWLSRKRSQLKPASPEA